MRIEPEMKNDGEAVRFKRSFVRLLGFEPSEDECRQMIKKTKKGALEWTMSLGWDKEEATFLVEGEDWTLERFYEIVNSSDEIADVGEGGTHLSPAYIYILSNPSNKYLKIGWTGRVPEERAKELSSGTGVPTPYKVEKAYEFKSGGEARSKEKELHNRLDDCRVSSKREFFECGLKKVTTAVEAMLCELSQK